MKNRQSFDIWFQFCIGAPRVVKVPSSGDALSIRSRVVSHLWKTTTWTSRSAAPSRPRSAASAVGAAVNV